jgi:competence protein ComEC
MRRGISAVCYADSAEWALKRMHDDRLTMAQAATSCRDKAISFFRSLGIGGDNLALLSALTLGYRNTLDRELREAYSTAGVSHVLAVSGMHIGFICAVLMFLLRIVPLRGRAAKAIKYLIATAALWAYVFFIGMPVSAVRAACMFTLLLLADAIGRERNSMNNLLFSAYVMLLVRPMWLLDVGFQLSFMAVAAMLIVVPWLHRRYSPRNPIARYAWGILSATIAAQIGTAPLTLLYFHRFPTLFFITNPLIVLLASLIIYSAMLLLPLCLLTAARPFAGEVLNYLLSLQNSLVRAISQVPHAAVGNTCIRWHEAVLLYAFIAFGMAYIGRHTARRLLLSLSMLATFASSRVEFAMTHRPANALAIYSYNGAPVVHCMAADGHSWAVTDTASTVRPASLTHFCSTHGLKTPVVVSADYHNRQLTVRDQIVCYRGRKICMLTDNHWSGVSAGEPLRVDYVLVCRGFSGSLADALRLFSPHCVLLDSSLSSRRRERYSRICHEKKLRYRELSEKGCISILL